MCSHCWNKLIAVSFALALAGVLMCAVALLDVFIPRGSVAGFLASMALLGLIVTGVVIGYTWVCEKCESYFNERIDRRLARNKPKRSDEGNPGSSASPRPAERRVIGGIRSTPGARQPPLLCERYVSTLRYSVRGDATKATMARTWHGQ
jgi:hypothetical protein